MKQFYLLLVLITIASKITVKAQTTVTVNPHVKYQTIEGWGGSLCWWAVVAGGFDNAKVDQICQMITSPDELNMNVFRYNIGGGENPSHNHMRIGGEVPGFKASASANYDWSQDANQRKILLKLNSMRNDVINEAFSNSPPHWMTKSGCTAGNTDGSDNLRDDQYQAFADYLTEIVKHYKENWGITFRTIDPFNEPFSNWWKVNNNQEGCKFNLSNQQKMILELYNTLRNKQMLSYTGISAMDANSLNETVDGINGYISAGNVMSKIVQINSHSYFGSRRSDLESLAKNNGKRLWQSESGPLSVNTSGIDNNLVMAQRILTDLRELKPVVWCDWQLGADNEPSWSLINLNYSNQSVRKNKNYYIRMQCSRFIKQGYTIIETNQNNTIAALDPANKELVMVIVNQATSAQNMTLDLSLFNTIGTPQIYRTSNSENCIQSNGGSFQNKKLNYSAPNQSITTFVIPVTYNPPVTFQGIFQFIARHSNKVIEVGTNAVSGDSLFQNTNNNMPNQLWNVTPVNGYYKIINNKTGLSMDVNGESLNDGAQVIQYAYSGNDNQLWNIFDLGNGYFQIINKKSEKCLDVSGESLVDHTRIIQYKNTGGYNQQFLLMPQVITALEKDSEAELRCYPNPFTENFRLQGTGGYKYCVNDLFGREILKGVFFENAIIGESLEPGCYILKIEKGVYRQNIKLIKK